MVRLLTAGLLVPALWLLIKVAPQWTFRSVAVVVISLACWECLGLLRVDAARPFRALALAGCWAVLWSFTGLEPAFDAGLPVLIVTLVSILAAMQSREDPSRMLESALRTLFPVVYVGVALGYLVGLHNCPGEDGEDLLMLLFICVTFGDSMAYYVGSAFGRHRMTPVLSPKKSWEGAAAGLGASVGGALLAHFWFYQRLPIGHALILGVSLGIAGMLGDLSVSMVKRAAGSKDSSRLLPGHGGMLDRTDSLLFAAPILYYYYEAFLLRSP